MEGSIKVSLELGSETYFAQSNTAAGLVSDQVISIKERTMTILKDFITKHNIPDDDVPDDDEEVDDEDEISAIPPVKKSKKRQ